MGFLSNANDDEFDTDGEPLAPKQKYYTDLETEQDEYDAEGNYIGTTHTRVATPYGNRLHWVIILIVVAFIAFCAFQRDNLKTQFKNAAESSDVAAQEAETITLNKKYKGKTPKSDPQHMYFKTYTFEITEAGQIGVQYSCKDDLFNRAHKVMWEIIEKDSDKKILESKYHSFDIEMIDVQPGEYIIQFHSQSNSLFKDLVKNKYSFEIIYEKNK